MTELLELGTMVEEAEVIRTIILLSLSWKGKRVDCTIQNGEVKAATLVHGDGTCDILLSAQRQVIFEEIKRRGLV